MDKQTLLKLHNVEMQILEKVDSICKKKGIQYYLIGGTLLGAVRHRGFIPWDDDIDIGMPRNDYERFIDACLEGDLGKDYYLHHISTDDYYWLSYAKIRKNNTLFEEEEIKELNCHKGIFIDVFPLDFVNADNKIVFKIKTELVKNLSHVVFERVLKVKSASLYSKVLFLITRPLTVKRISTIRDFFAKKSITKEYYINYGGTYSPKIETHPVDIYGKPREIEFEGKLFYAPEKSEDFLRHVYGDYMKLPPEGERRNHNPSKVLFKID